VHSAIGLPADTQDPPPISLQSQSRGAQGVGKLGAGVTAKVADASGSFVRLVGKQGSAYPGLLHYRQAVVPVLAEQAIEGAGLIEDSQVFIAIFRPIPIGEIGVTDPAPAGANPISDAIGGQGVMIPANIALFSAGPDKPTPDIVAQTAVAFPPRANEALVDTKITLFPRFILRRLCRQTEGLPRLSVHCLDKGPELGEIGAQAIGTKLHRLGNEQRLPATITASDNGFGG